MADHATTTTRDEQAAPAVPRSGSEAPATTGGTPHGTRLRRTAFRVLSVALALWVLLLNVFGLTEVVLMWLPAETVGSIVGGGADELPSMVAHRSHFMAIGILAWAAVLPTMAQLRRPERRVGSMRFLVVLALAALVVFGLSGTLGEWMLEEWTWVLPVLVLAALHPRARDLVRVPDHDRRQLALAAAAAVPWTWYALASARLQLANVAGDEHAELEHWAIAALLGVIVVAGAAIGSGRTEGWRLPAWIAASASTLFGVHSLAFPGAASGLATGAGLAAIVWGLAYAGATIARGRRAAEAPAPDRASATATVGG